MHVNVDDDLTLENPEAVTPSKDARDASRDAGRPARIFRINQSWKDVKI